MEKNIFRIVFKRENVLLNGIYTLFLAFASYPRLALEVHIRRRMGRRYFTIASAVTVAVILLFLPALIYQGQTFSYVYGDGPDVSFWGEFTSWYMFTFLFIWNSRKRSKETFSHSNLYDFNHFSMSTGKSHPLFYELPFLKYRPNGYDVEVFIEPAFFFVIGFLLMLMGQPVGTLLIICSLCYGLSYAGAYKIQDDYFQDRIDEIIQAEEIYRAFVMGYEADQTRGVHFGRRPNDEKLRRKMASKFYPENDVVDAEFTVL